MNKSQAVAELAVALSRSMPAEESLHLIRRALRRTGLTYTNTLTDADITSMLSALAAEGGPVQEMAEWIAVNGIGAGQGRLSL